jgi:hypothetical protein
VASDKTLPVRPSVELTRPRGSANFDLQKLEKPAIAARVQRFVGFVLVISAAQNLYAKTKGAKTKAAKPAFALTQQSSQPRFAELCTCILFRWKKAPRNKVYLQ